MAPGRRASRIGFIKGDDPPPAVPQQGLLAAAAALDPAQPTVFQVAAPAPAVAPEDSSLVPMKLWPAIQAVGTGLALRFLVPIPAGITPQVSAWTSPSVQPTDKGRALTVSAFPARKQGWSLLSIFASTVLGLVLDPLPVGAWAFVSMTACIATQTLTFEQAFSGKACWKPAATGASSTASIVWVP